MRQPDNGQTAPIPQVLMEVIPPSPRWWSDGGDHWVVVLVGDSMGGGGGGGSGGMCGMRGEGVGSDEWELWPVDPSVCVCGPRISTTLFLHHHHHLSHLFVFFPTQVITFHFHSHSVSVIPVNKAMCIV